MQILLRRRRDGIEQGWFLEAIAATALLLEYELKLWRVQVSGHDVADDERRTLGAEIDVARKMGFDPDLVRRLTDFKRTRNDAIHRLLLGVIRYQELGEVLESDRGLLRDLIDWIHGQLPKVVGWPPDPSLSWGP